LALLIHARARLVRLVIALAALLGLLALFPGLILLPGLILTSLLTPLPLLVLGLVALILLLLVCHVDSFEGRAVARCGQCIRHRPLIL
jgi:hypothetical protein